MNRSIRFVLLPAMLFACFTIARSQTVAIGVAGEVTQGGVHLRISKDLAPQFRLGIEYTDYFRRFSGWNCTNAIWSRSWYSDFNFSFVKPIKEKWGIYTRTGLGLEYLHRFSDKQSEGLGAFQNSKELNTGIHLGAGGEFKFTHWKIFADLMGRINYFSDEEAYANLLFGIAYTIH